MGLCLSPFFNIGAMLASFQSSGTWPVDSEVLNIISKMGDILRLSSFKTVGVIESGPAALCGFRFERRARGFTCEHGTELIIKDFSFSLRLTVHLSLAAKWGDCRRVCEFAL